MTFANIHLVKNFLQCASYGAKVSMFSCGKTFYIWSPENFWFSKVLWEHQSIEKFLHDFFFPLASRTQGGIQLQICFCTIKDLPIWFFGNNGIFHSQNSYGYKTLWNSFRAIFLVFGSKFKSCSQWPKK